MGMPGRSAKKIVRVGSIRRVDAGIHKQTAGLAWFRRLAELDRTGALEPGRLELVDLLGRCRLSRRGLPDLGRRLLPTISEARSARGLLNNGGGALRLGAATGRQPKTGTAKGQDMRETMGHQSPSFGAAVRRERSIIQAIPIESV